MYPFAALFQTRADHLAPLSGLRGVAALWVTLFHLWQFAAQPSLQLGPVDFTPLISTGYVGVDLFFVLSGFLLGWPFLRAREAGSAMPSLKRFWMHRARRVLPAYWIQILVLFVILYLGTGVAPLAPGEVLAQLSMTFNLTGTRTINPVHWSLPVEWNFYVLLPLLALGFFRGQRFPWLLLVALGFAVLFRVVCWQVLHTYGVEGVRFYGWVIQLPGRLDQFVFGMAAAWWVQRGISPWLATLSGIAGGIGVLVMCWVLAPLGDVPSTAKVPWLYWYFSALGACFALVLISVSARPASALARAVGTGTLVWLGTISYSLYLWHYPVFQGLRWVGLTTGWLWWTVGLLAALLVSALAYLLVERPFLAKS